MITVFLWFQSVDGSAEIVAVVAAVVVVVVVVVAVVVVVVEEVVVEKIIGKEIVFLNDFEYDDDAKKWLAWSYLKNMMEGEKLDVARPKNRGVGNLEWTDTSPIFIAARSALPSGHYYLGGAPCRSHGINRAGAYRFHATNRVPPPK